jgi:hypothetical protein
MMVSFSLGEKSRRNMVTNVSENLAEKVTFTVIATLKVTNRELVSLPL